MVGLAGFSQRKKVSRKSRERETINTVLSRVVSPISLKSSSFSMKYCVEAFLAGRCETNIAILREAHILCYQYVTVSQSAHISVTEGIAVTVRWGEPGAQRLF